MSYRFSIWIVAMAMAWSVHAAWHRRSPDLMQLGFRILIFLPPGAITAKEKESSKVRKGRLVRTFEPQGVKK